MTSSATTPGSQAAHVIVDDGALTIGVIGAGIAGLAAIGLIATLLNGSFVLAIFLGLVVLIAGLFGWLGLRQHLRWEPAELHFDEWPLALGSTNHVRLRRRSKRPLANTTLSITSELRCTEEARYTVGTDTHTATHTAVEHHQTIQASLADKLLTATVPLVIPLDAGGPTLDLTDNKISWELKLDTEGSGFLNRSSFDLHVAPILDRSARHIQDATEEPG